MAKKKEIKFPELLSEMARRGESQEELARVLGMSRSTLYMRMTGKVEWTIGDIERLCEHYNKDYYQLFK